MSAGADPEPLAPAANSSDDSPGMHVSQGPIGLPVQSIQMPLGSPGSASPRSNSPPRSPSLLSRTIGPMTPDGVRHSTLTLTCTALGGGLLAASYIMCKAGIILGCIMLAIGGCVSHFSTRKLMEMSNITGHATYAQLLSHCAGPRAGPMLDFMLFIYGCGACIGYTVFISDFVPDIVKGLDLNAPPLVQSRLFAIGLAFILSMPLVLQKDVAALKNVTPVSIMALVYMLFVITLKAPGLYEEHKADVAKYGKLELVKFDIDAVEMFSLCIFAFNCHLNVVPVGRKLVQPTKKRIMKVSMWVNVVQYIFYVMIGIMGYISFLDKTPGDLIKGYDAADKVVMVGRIMLTCTFLVAIPLNTFPTIKSGMQFLDYLTMGTPASLQHGAMSPSIQVNREPLRIPMTIICVCIYAAVAYLVPTVAVVLGLLGATVAAAMMLAIPAYLMGKILEPKLKHTIVRAALYFCSLLALATVPIKILRWTGVLPPL